MGRELSFGLSLSWRCRLQPQSWSGEWLESPTCTREGVKAAMRRCSQI